MPELRQNIVTREWVIIASERSRRPNDFTDAHRRTLTEAHNAYDAGCPFCPGNEELDLEVERFPREGLWQTRVVRNKFPALQNDGIPARDFSGVYHRISGVGYHEVLVDHPRHNTTLALMSPHEIHLVLDAFQRRGIAMSGDPRIEHIIYFKNHGESAGASLQHPHSQIIALPVVPGGVHRRMEAARHYFRDMGRCSVCDMLQSEAESQERMIGHGKHFSAFLLFAALSPFHIWVVPHRHMASFLDVEPHEMADLAQLLGVVLRRIYFTLHDPDYNMIIRTTPVRETNCTFFHWYLSLVPRVSRMAGFEMGSGMHINPCLPEECASFLKTDH
jgi:UDPglucose--hexose-1-phosphate uridylyltransferase